jgi:hypothetical protein
VTRLQRICAIAISISLAIGVVFGLLPRNWIELRLGFDPDGGSGWVESLLIFIPIAIAAGIVILVFRPRPSMPSNRRLDSALRPPM